MTENNNPENDEIDYGVELDKWRQTTEEMRAETPDNNHVEDKNLINPLVLVLSSLLLLAAVFVIGG